MQDPKPDSIALGDYCVELTDTDDPDIRAAVLEPLKRFNRSQAGESNSRPLSIVTRDAHGHIVGGLHGSTSWGWLFTQLLVLPEALRGKGLGKQLMLRAEAEATRRGCHSAWLDTFEFQDRRGFYENLGYRCVASLADYPLGFSRFIMEKSLTTTPTPRGEG
jgi:GNAT superfamily N-acetyltransferase